MLELAAQKGHDRCIKAIMVKAEADDFIKCIELLVRPGADVNKNDYKHESPLVIALNYGFDEGVCKLLSAGADVNTYAYGLSPLMHAAAVGFPKCVQLLLTAGADVNERDANFYHYRTAFTHLGTKLPYFIKDKIGDNETLQQFVSRIKSMECDKSVENIKGNEILLEVVTKIDVIESGKLLLRAGARINGCDWNLNNGLMNYICARGERAERDICMFFYAAGEMIDGSAVTADVHDDWSPWGGWYNRRRADVPNYFTFEDLQFDLMHLCRQTIRKHLLSADPHEHLFGRIPRLGLPKPLTRYLLFNFSLED